MNGNAISIHPSEVFAESLRTFFAPFRVNSTYARSGHGRERVSVSVATEFRDNSATLPALLSFVVDVVVGTFLFLLALVLVVLLQAILHALLSTVLAAPVLANGLRVAQWALLATDTFLFLSLLVRSSVNTLRRV